MPATETPVDKSEGRVREMFRQVAPRYDLMNHLLSLNIDRYWRWRAARTLKYGSDAPLLDVCTGTGDLAFMIARRAATGPVVGCDFCGAMLRLAQRKQPPDPQRQVHFLEADAQTLPFPDETFQAVTVAFGLRNVADTDRGLSEMARVCRPGGQVLVLEFSSPTLPGFRQLYRFYFNHVLPRIGEALARNDKAAYRYLNRSVGQFPDGPQLLERMEMAGLAETAYRPLTGGVATIYLGTKPPGGAR